VVRHGGDTAQEILHPTYQQTLIARDGYARFERWVGPPARIDIADPVLHMTIVFAGVETRQAVELQMIVRIDQSREHAIALQIDHPVAVDGIRTQ